ncbi:hypothetical protein IMCC20628_00473 [Hoeflea sp. IMCC20628]|uniref:hypothetical protein n=1 Tax=Hoeflea sp. IMCC20628 TaxID=1620421 RepID=UPI00063AFF2F|nr:hypothetical protein [Hoeflea sp. IMCC20628]AKH99198.1 hypothetical protein IMCC20628_00473 [Hoeflea sp. IMCC20628]
MIEFVLLFALGFLAAALVALIAAPIIQRRIVSLTERRIRASVPLSAAEIRAEKDMARAAFAAETARLSVDLKHNREKLTQSVARGSRLSNDLVALRGEKILIEKAIEERDDSIRDLNAKINQRDAAITTLTGNFSDAARLSEALKHELAARDDKINRLGAKIEELRIDLVTLDTEAENFKAQIRELRDERNAVRDLLTKSETSNRDLEIRLKNHDERLAQSQEKLAKTITTLTDRENALDRRIAEVERFRQKNRELSDEIRAAKSALKEAVSAAKKSSPAVKPATPPPLQLRAVKPTPIGSGNGKSRDPGKEELLHITDEQNDADEESDFHEDIDGDIPEAEKIDRLRARQAALAERLLKADKSGNDPALRRELAVVAAMMVELTVGRDGSASPIFAILKGSEGPTGSGSSEPSLASRVREMLTADQ